MGTIEAGGGREINAKVKKCLEGWLILVSVLRAICILVCFLLV